MRKTSKKIALRRISWLREQLKDLNDYLELLETRAHNKSKRRFTTEQVRKQLGLA